MALLAIALRLVAFGLGIAQLLWIAGYALELAGSLGLILVWLFFPLTLVISPWWAVLARGDWLGVAFFVSGLVTYLVHRLLGVPRSGEGLDERGRADDDIQPRYPAL